MTKNKTEDWAAIAQAVRYADPHGKADQPALLAAADLCERMARGELASADLISDLNALVDQNWNDSAHPMPARVREILRKHGARR